jgi:peptidoglycan/LPS O-acetylase OafA/YrhL
MMELNMVTVVEIVVAILLAMLLISFFIRPRQNRGKTVRLQIGKANNASGKVKLNIVRLN